MNNLGFNTFKSQICNYYSSCRYLSNKMEHFKDILDKIVYYELPRRDNELLFQVRGLKNTVDLDLSIKYNNIMCNYCNEKKSLIVGVSAPNWKTGWEDISKDVIISQEIEHLFHFISQYIYRSYQINLIGAIALSTGRAIDFRCGSVMYLSGQNYNNIFNTSLRKNLSFLDLKTLKYLKLINALDPYVNQAIFYYTKFLKLYEIGFVEEALTAADNMVDVIFQSIKERLKKPTKSRKKMGNYVYNEIGLDDRVIKHNLDRLYLLRCRFTAHPSESKWWDFYEIYEAEIEEISYSVRKLLIAYLKYENKNREIEAMPTLWSSWFKEYCSDIYDAIWFHKIP